MKRLFISAMIMIVFSILLWPPEIQSGSPLVSIDSTAFRLLQGNEGHLLVDSSGMKIEIPAEWLRPPDGVAPNETSIVSSFDYDEQVTVFPIGNGLSGVHISSYATQKEGSTGAAAGRDVFLFFDPDKREIHLGNLSLGVTKERVRVYGCYHASFHDFMIGDINDDSLTDIAVIFEKIWCEQRFDEEKEVDIMVGPFHTKDPIKWHVFSAKGWTYEPEYDGKTAKDILVKLPLIGLVKSPIEFVKEITKLRLIER